jgi:hypothetical protein
VTPSERRQGILAGLGQEESRLERGPRKHSENLGIPKIKGIGRKDEEKGKHFQKLSFRFLTIFKVCKY